MNPAREEQEPTRDQLLAMAYCDGELALEDRVLFESRLAQEPALLREVSELKSLEVLSRRVAPREPGDLVLETLDHEPLQVGLSRLALAGLLVGLTLSVGCGLWAFFTSAALSLLERFICVSILGGLTLLFLLILRQRVLLIPHDPYRSVER